jgi:hypothetical protein
MAHKDWLVRCLKFILTLLSISEVLLMDEPVSLGINLFSWLIGIFLFRSIEGCWKCKPSCRTSQWKLMFISLFLTCPLLAINLWLWDSFLLPALLLFTIIVQHWGIHGACFSYFDRDIQLPTVSTQQIPQASVTQPHEWAL